MASRIAVPIRNEIDAAAKDPAAFPSLELIGACMATSPPAMAVRTTATPLSTGPHLAASQFSPRSSLQPHDAQMFEVAIEFFDDVARVGKEMVLNFVHRTQFSSKSAIPSRI